MIVIPSHLIQRNSLPLVLFLLALGVRLVFLAATFQGNDNVPYFEDVAIAKSMIEGRGYTMDYSGLRVTNEFFGTPPEVSIDEIEPRPTAIKPPIYPLVVALIFKLFGDGDFFAVFILHAILAALTCVLVFRLAHYAGKWTAIMGASIFALYPPFVYHSISTPESTTLLLFLFSLFLLLILRYREARSASLVLVSAMVAAVIILTEVVAIPFVCAGLIYVLVLPPSTLGLHNVSE